MKTVWRALANIALLVFSLAAGVAQATEAVAMVTDLKGNAWMQGRGKEERLNVASYLEQGDVVRLDNKATVTITSFKPATEYIASGPARLELKDGEIRFSGGGKLDKRNQNEQKANAARQFSVEQRGRITMAAVEMKDMKIGLQLLAPVNAKLLNTRPEFKWSAPPETKNFVVTLFDESDKKPVSEATVNEPGWRLPDNISLQYQHQYSWKVRAELPSAGKVAATGKFSVMDEAGSRKILQQKPSGNAPFSERVLYAVWLESEDLKLDAADEWKTLANERPDEPLLKMHAR